MHDNPAYTASEAARILGLPVATLKAWSFGQVNRTPAGELRKFHAVIRPADAKRRLLSFANLCELHVLSAIRRQHKVSLPKVRASVEYVREKLGSDRPLLDRDFKTNGVDLFVRHASKLLNVTKQGQEALRGDFELALARIERDGRGAPIRLFPFSRSSQTERNQPRTVVIDPHLAFGRPVISQIAVPTAIIIDRFRAGDSMAEMAGDYGVREEDIEEALRFEQRLAA
ncbi:DUF433 domain-containing protein [Sulfuritalea sp.]|uniref:DUF433 domain-containing protein n=1 Tax=Sulfuritalea sp. TaxID=2480090 RepID=UPI001ACE46E7|nr:DUF433 domain-containing protein [Sulfuritalea sp.]MBN8473702.1 DUF433 domain-containing protein [Sulfuritalea sp.]